VEFHTGYIDYDDDKGITEDRCTSMWTDVKVFLMNPGCMIINYLHSAL